MNTVKWKAYDGRSTNQYFIGPVGIKYVEITEMIFGAKPCNMREFEK